jgi:hypothetical protein
MTIGYPVILARVSDGSHKYNEALATSFKPTLTRNTRHSWYLKVLSRNNSVNSSLIQIEFTIYTKRCVYC